MLYEPIDTKPWKDPMVTPYFRHLAVEDIPASEREGKLVMRTIEAVEIRIAGDNKFVGVFPVDAMAFRDGRHTITYAERFADEYKMFLEGAAQESAGTPLEELAAYGITPAQLSICRALKVYSIEALHRMDGPNLRSLGVHANALREMADRYMADRATGSAAQKRIEELEAKLAELQGQTLATSADLGPVSDDDSIDAGQFDALTDDQLKTYIKDTTGSAPRGQPSRERLLAMAREA
ncbi:hypothetical protein [Asaia sp. HN010]|uniref:hypothetical protein n=1 Tax=Asaia sp. HN010 TaxID=3081233 RepID=UPI003016E2A6